MGMPGVWNNPYIAKRGKFSDSLGPWVVGPKLPDTFMALSTRTNDRGVTSGRANEGSRLHWNSKGLPPFNRAHKRG